MDRDKATYSARDHLKRLSPEHYRGQAHVHWSMTIIAAKFFRAQMNPVLEKLGAQFRQQAYDHVLREGERERTAFEDVVEYIAGNPERAGLVPVDGFRRYPYTGCLVPGYLDLSPWQDDYWDLFWRLYLHLRTRGLVRASAQDSQAVELDAEGNHNSDEHT